MLRSVRLTTLSAIASTMAASMNAGNKNNPNIAYSERIPDYPRKTTVQCPSSISKSIAPPAPPVNQLKTSFPATNLTYQTPVSTKSAYPKVRKEDQLFKDILTQFQNLHQTSPTCSVSYAWVCDGDDPRKKEEQEAWINRFAQHLAYAGFRVTLDRWGNMNIGRVSPFVSRVASQDKVFVIGTPLLSIKSLQSHRVIHDEIQAIQKRWAENEEFLCLVLKEGDRTVSFPSAFSDSVCTDMRLDSQYPGVLMEMLAKAVGLTREHPHYETFVTLKNQLVAGIRHISESQIKEGVPFQLSATIPPYFTGREAEKGWIIENLKPGKKLGIVAAGGLGKSTLVNVSLLEMMTQNELQIRFPDGVIRVDCYATPYIDSAMRHIVHSLNPGYETSDTLNDMRYLLSHKQVLIVLDGVEAYAKQAQLHRLDTFYDALGQASVLLSTREKSDAPRAKGFMVWELRPLDQKAGEDRALFQQLAAPDDRELSEPEKKLSDQITQKLGGLPLAIEIAASNAKEGGGVESYWNWIKGVPLEFEALDDDISKGRESHRGIRILLDKSVESCGETERLLLGVMGVLSFQSIGREVLEKVIVSEGELSKGIRRLINLSLIQQASQEAVIHVAGKSRYEASHLLIKEYSKDRFRLGGGQFESVSRYYINLAKIQSSDKSQHGVLDLEKGHIVALTQASNNRETWKLSLELYGAIREYLDFCCYFEEEVQITQSGLVAAREMGDQEAQGTLLNSLGNVLRVQGAYEEAKRYFLKAIEIYKAMYGTKAHVAVGKSYNNLGGALAAQGEYEEAKGYYVKAIDIYKEVYGKEEHVDVGKSYNNLGLVLYAQGAYEKAKGYYVKAIDIYKEVYGKEEHVDVGKSYNNLGGVLKAQGAYEEAQGYHQKALKIYKAAYGTEAHVDVAGGYNNLGLVLKAQGKVEEAKGYFLKALEIYKVAYGTEAHVDVGKSYNNLGEVLYSQDAYEEAKGYYVKAIDIYKAVYGKEEHVDVAQSYNNLGGVLYSQGEIEEAKGYFQKAIEIKKAVYGKEEHVDVAGSYSNLGGVLYSQGEVEEAKGYFQKAIEIYKVVYGTESHVDVAMSYGNLGSLLLREDNPNEALPYCEKSHRIFSERLPATHPDIQQSKQLLQYCQARINFS